MRRLLPLSALLVLSCGHPTPLAPEASFLAVVDSFHPAAVAFADQVSREFADNALDPTELHRCAGFAALLTASQRLMPDFPILAQDREDLAYFALCLGQVTDKPEAWKVRLLPEQGDAANPVASIELPADSGAPAFYLRLARDRKLEWKLSSWPPVLRAALHQPPAGAVRILLRSWPPEGSPEGLRAAIYQVECQGKALYDAGAGDPWHRLTAAAPELFRADQPLFLLAEPEVPAALLLGLLEALARTAIGLSLVQLGTPGEALDVYYPLEQQRAGEPHAEDLILTAAASDEEWSAALAGTDPSGAIGLRLAPALPMSTVIADLQRLQKRGLSRVFIALPAG